MRFKVNGPIVVTDPGYGDGSGFKLDISNPKRGIWLCDANVDDVVEYITAFSSGHSVDEGEWVYAGKISVDSGLVVIANKDKLFPEDDEWFFGNFDNDEDFGEFDGGVFCTSGYGDGVYDVQIQEVNGEIVAIEIVFI